MGKWTEKNPTQGPSPRPTPTSDAGVVGYPHATDAVVGHRGHFARTPCTMPVRVKSAASEVGRARQAQPEEQQGHQLPPPMISVPRVSTVPCHTRHLGRGRLRSDQTLPQSPSGPRGAGQT